MEHVNHSQFCLSNLWESPINWIPELNLSNRSHTSQDTCLISEKQLSCSHECVKADSRTDPTEDLGTDLESAHVLFPVQADSMKPLPVGRAVMTMLRERGMGADGQWCTWCAHKMYGQPFCLLRTHIVPSILISLYCPFSISLNRTCSKSDWIQVIKNKTKINS